MGNYSRLGGSDAGKRFAGKSQAAGYLKATTLPFAVSSTSGGGGHDPPVFIGIAVAIVNVRHAALPVVGDAVHHVAAEAEPGDRRQTGSPQIVRCGALDPEPGDGLPHEHARHLAGSLLLQMVLDQIQRGLRQPDPVIPAVLGPRPVTLRLARHLPPAVDDVFALHRSDLAGPLAC